MSPAYVSPYRDFPDNHYRILVTLEDGTVILWQCTGWPSLEAAKKDISVERINDGGLRAARVDFYEVTHRIVASEVLLKGEAAS